MGLALALLAFKTDPTYLPTPRTLAGAIHDGAYALLGLSLLPGMLLLAAELRHREPWRALALPTLLTVLLAAPAFVLKGMAFYGFLALILTWFLLIAVRRGLRRGAAPLGRAGAARLLQRAVRRAGPPAATGLPA